MIDQLRAILQAFESGRRDNDAAEVKQCRRPVLLMKGCRKQTKTLIREINNELFHYSYHIRIGSPSRMDSRTGAIHIMAHAINRCGRNGHVLGHLTMQSIDENTVGFDIYLNGSTVVKRPEQTTAVFNLNESCLPAQVMKASLTKFVNWCLHDQLSIEEKLPRMQ
jgi:hypothetical protein